MYDSAREKLNGRKLSWTRGKMLGGSSSLNALIYHHCAPEDFDAWAEQGATDWGYETMKRYVRKTERYSPRPDMPTDTSSCGDSGRWKTRHPDISPLSTKILQAAESLGIRNTADFNTAEGTLGVGRVTACIDEKYQRTSLGSISMLCHGIGTDVSVGSSTATAYLSAEVLRRPNLTVAVTITTEQVLFDRDGDGASKAVGIKISKSRDGPQYRVGARKEVIICAGAPQLLMVSGVGPAVHLHELNISVVCDNPSVGKNLLDVWCFLCCCPTYYQ